jgi:hypothetical protein
VSRGGANYLLSCLILIVGFGTSACVANGREASGGQRSPVLGSDSRVAAPSSSTGTPAPDFCSADAAQVRVEAFLQAFNRGDDTIVGDYIAKGDEFRWFATPERPYPGPGSERGGLESYLASKHQEGARWSLGRFEWTGVQNGLSNFATRIDDTQYGDGGEAVSGKGALTCDSGHIAVWLIEAAGPK